jgi:hypothetical protein
MSLSPELLWPILSLIVLIGIAWGAIQYTTRNKALDQRSERATRELMDDPGPEPMKDDHRQEPGGAPSPSEANRSARR